MKIRFQLAAVTRGGRTGRVLVASAWVWGLAQAVGAALLLNIGPSAQSGQGPTGADSAWLAYTTPHETSTTGQLSTFNGIGFASVAGTYNVGVQFSWGAGAPNAAKQSINRNSSGQVNFYNNWMGTDAREAGLDTMTLTLSGLPANTSFTLTSYHFDTFDQTGKFTTSVTGTQQFDIGNGAESKAPYIYDFSIVSNSSGGATIDYINVPSGTITQQFYVMNGFALDAIPEPASLGMMGVVTMALLLRRRMMRQ